MLPMSPLGQRYDGVPAIARAEYGEDTPATRWRVRYLIEAHGLPVVQRGPDLDVRGVAGCVPTRRAGRDRERRVSAAAPAAVISFLRSHCAQSIERGVSETASRLRAWLDQHFGQRFDRVSAVIEVLELRRVTGGGLLAVVKVRLGPVVIRRRNAAGAWIANGSATEASYQLLRDELRTPSAATRMPRACSCRTGSRTARNFRRPSRAGS
jgi:hypothetical protein